MNYLRRLIFADMNKIINFNFHQQKCAKPTQFGKSKTTLQTKLSQLNLINYAWPTKRANCFWLYQALRAFPTKIWTWTTNRLYKPHFKCRQVNNVHFLTAVGFTGISKISVMPLGTKAVRGRLCVGTLWALHTVSYIQRPITGCSLLLQWQYWPTCTALSTGTLVYIWYMYFAHIVTEDHLQSLYGFFICLFLAFKCFFQSDDKK